MTRICITGGPRTGKTTLALATPCNQLYHCDEFIGMGWSESSAYVAGIMGGHHPSWVIEGVQVARALRKALGAHPDAKPCDRLIILNTPHVGLTAGQASMAKGVHTVLDEILPELRRLGVEVEERT